MHELCIKSSTHRHQTTSAVQEKKAMFFTSSSPFFYRTAWRVAPLYTTAKEGMTSDQLKHAKESSVFLPFFRTFELDPFK